MKLKYVLYLPFIFLFSCKFTKELDVLNPMGEIAMQEKDLIIIAVLLMMIVIVPVMFMIVVFSVKYRESNKKAKYTPNWDHNTTFEVIWWTIPCIIIVILAIITWKTTHKLDPYRPLDSKEKPVIIQVVALDWKWLFIYPEHNIATVNFIQFPVNVPINFEITADAPMNSFAIPQLGGQIYAMSGMETKLHLIANEIGVFKGFSANYSGSGFSGMKFTAKASSKNEFKNWVQSIKYKNNRLSNDVYSILAKPSKKNPVTSFSSVENNLFDNIKDKYMIMDHKNSHKIKNHH